MSQSRSTHKAYVLKRETRTRGRWLEIGLARIESDAHNGSHHIHLDRLPVGGFGGHILLHPIGQQPADPLTPTMADDGRSEEA